MLAFAQPSVVEAPQLGALRLGLPLPELVAQREDALLGTGLLLVASGTPEDGIELVLQDGVEQGRGLEAVARRIARLFAHAALVDGLLHGGHDEALAHLLDAAIAELEHLWEVVAGVDVHHRKGKPRRAEGLLGQPHHHDGVLAAREQQHRPLELGGHLAHDEHRL